MQAAKKCINFPNRRSKKNFFFASKAREYSPRREMCSRTNKFDLKSVESMLMCLNKNRTRLHYTLRTKFSTIKRTKIGYSLFFYRYFRLFSFFVRPLFFTMEVTYVVYINIYVTVYIAQWLFLLSRQIFFPAVTCISLSKVATCKTQHGVSWQFTNTSVYLINQSEWSFAKRELLWDRRLELREATFYITIRRRIGWIRKRNIC